MSDDIVLYTNPQSRGRMARWMLEEVGVPYRTEILQYADSMKAPAYLAINPMGKVPALTHRGQVVTETAAICAYLADAFPDACLAPPPTSPLRAPYYRWLFFAAGPTEAAITNTFLGFEVPAEKARMLGYGTMEAMLDAMEHALTDGPYLLGSQFSAADVYFGSQIGFGLMFKTIQPRPAFAAYFETLRHRPAYQRASALDDALIAAKQP